MQKRISFFDFLSIFKITLPVLLGYIPLGMGFGILASQNGLPVYISLLMSVFMYAGAGQYMAIGLFSAKANISTIVITEILLNIRHIVYGLSLVEKFKNCGKFKPYLIFALTDETYSLLTTSEKPKNISEKKFYFTISLLNQIYWIIGSVLGAILGFVLKYRTNFDFAGIDFSLTALFAVLFIEQIRTSKNYFAAFTGIFSTIFTVVLWRFGAFSSASNILVFSLAIGLCVISFFKRKNYESE